MDVHERYITCDMEEVASLRYDVTISISIPETDELVGKDVAVALSQTIQGSPELEDLGVTAEILSFTEEGEPETSILPSAASKALPSFAAAVVCALALVLN